MNNQPKPNKIARMTPSPNQYDIKFQQTEQIQQEKQLELSLKKAEKNQAQTPPKRKFIRKRLGRRKKESLPNSTQPIQDLQFFMSLPHRSAKPERGPDFVKQQDSDDQYD